MSSSGSNLERLNALLVPGAAKEFAAFGDDFCLTDAVMDLWTFPEGMDSKGACAIWLVTPDAGTSEILFQAHVEKHGYQVHFISGIFCPKGSYLSANAAVFAEGQTGDLRVLLTGYHC